MKKLYKRFGIEINREGAEEMFRQKLENLLVYGRIGEQIFDEQNTKINIVWELANKLGLEYDDYLPSENVKYSRIFDDELEFEEYLFRTQTLLDILWKNNQKSLCKLLGHCLCGIIEDSPIDLGIKIMTYKIKAPQIFPTVSKFFDEEIENIIGVLEAGQYKDILEDFEGGLKLFLKAKTRSQFKDVIEDMLSVCDEVVKIVTGDKNKGLKHIFTKKEYQKFDLNNYQKEIFRNLRDWMDKIKHGSLKEITREDLEMIISFTANFIRFVLNKYVAKS